MAENKLSKPQLYDFVVATEFEGSEKEEQTYVGTKMNAFGAEGHMVLEIVDGVDAVHVRLLVEGVTGTRKGKHKKSIQAVPPCES